MVGKVQEKANKCLEKKTKLLVETVFRKQVPVLRHKVLVAQVWFKLLMGQAYFTSKTYEIIQIISTKVFHIVTCNMYKILALVSL